MSPKKVRPHLSEDIKNRIAGLRQSNLSYKQIFDILKKENVKTSLSAVKRIGQRFEIEGSVRRKSESGRPRASTVKDDHRLKMTVLKDRKKTYVDHSKEFKTAAGNSLSRMTISRRLNEVGFNSKKCAKKAIISCNKSFKIGLAHFFCSRVYITSRESVTLSHPINSSSVLNDESISTDRFSLYIAHLDSLSSLILIANVAHTFISPCINMLNFAPV